MARQLPEVVALHRYFIWANKMRTDFDALLPRFRADSEWFDQEVIEMNLYMSYWYAGLYVVIEGWKKLNFSDPDVDALLASPNVDLLRRYRNGVCHFQRDYFDERFGAFMRDGVNCVDWVRSLNRAFGRFFLKAASNA